MEERQDCRDLPSLSSNSLRRRHAPASHNLPEQIPCDNLRRRQRRTCIHHSQQQLRRCQAKIHWAGWVHQNIWRPGLPLLLENCWKFRLRWMEERQDCRDLPSLSSNSLRRRHAPASHNLPEQIPCDNLRRRQRRTCIHHSQQQLRRCQAKRNTLGRAPRWIQRLLPDHQNI